MKKTKNFDINRFKTIQKESKHINCLISALSYVKFNNTGLKTETEEKINSLMNELDEYDNQLIKESAILYKQFINEK